MAAQVTPPCPGADVWQRIDGWEVVIVVLIVLSAWTLVSVARFYFMVEIGKGRAFEHDSIQRAADEGTGPDHGIHD